MLIESLPGRHYTWTEGVGALIEMALSVAGKIATYKLMSVEGAIESVWVNFLGLWSMREDITAA